MRFQKFLIEGRSTPIAGDKATKLIQQNCKLIMKSDYYIFRGSWSSTAEWVIVDTTEFTRESANTGNYYTLLMDHILPSWRGWPKRSKSLVCSTSFNDAFGYGNEYIVYPYDNSKIAVCPSYDIWDSFDELKKIGMKNMDRFDHAISNILYDEIGTGYADNSKKELMDALMALDKVDKKRLSHVMGRKYNLFKDIQENESVIDYLDRKMDPKKNDFTRIKANQISKHLGKELWIEGKCIMNRMDEDEKKYYRFNRASKKKKGR